ncbi:MAG: glycosyltransferase family 4 protein [Anaerolineae bacterium]|nr:glycosyltransferase family 4 protein [Anaerolineae bacterium]
MKIVMVGPFGLRPRGTMSVRALPLAKALAARGHAVTLLLPPWQNPEDAGRVWEEEDVRVENLMLPARAPGWFHLRLAQALVRRTVALAPDVVHAFKPKAYAGLAHWLLAHRRHAPPVVVDTDDWEGPGGWNDLLPYSPVQKRVFAWQERWGLHRARAVTVASDALLTLAWAQGSSPERVLYVPNGVAWPFPPVTPVPHARPTLLLYTRFFEFDLDRFWRVLQQVRAVRPAIRLWVVGQGLFGEEERLLALARDAGWHLACETPPEDEADLVYAGWIGDERPVHFAQADVALYPFDDTLVNRTKCPVKLLDLLAAGIPVIGERVGEIPRMIVAGATGALAPPGNVSAFVEAIVGMIDAPERCREMGRQAARDVRERFSWARLAEIAEAAYHYARDAG